MNNKTAINNLRNKLVDLTKKNKLLNYCDSKRSSIRIIENSHKNVFEELLAGNKLTFAPIPTPNSEQLEEYFSDCDTATVPVKEYAERYLNINSDFELADEFMVPASKTLQALLYPRDLELNLKKIENSARIAMEEKGTNMLFLAFGFLQYYQHNASDKVFLAPLILFPVSIEKGKYDPKINSFKYHVYQTGDEALVNICLKEMLDKEFGIEIPEFDGVDVYEYFAKLEELLCKHTKWKIKKHLTLSLFQFEKILMYHDLDPSKWPSDNSILKNDLVSKFFASNDSEKVIDISSNPEYDIEKIREEDYPIIYDADSSQHSAIIDVLQGKNTVIEGPPGTGKSQTITNIIAAALSKGKKVLFIAEKQAALKVVKHRLDLAGLGHFCLDMHNTHRQQKEVLESLQERIVKYKKTIIPTQYDTDKKKLKTIKNILLDYTKIIASEYKDTGQTIHDILCSASLHKLKLSTFPDVLLNEAKKFFSDKNLRIEQMIKQHRVLEEYKIIAKSLNTDLTSLDRFSWSCLKNAKILRYEKNNIDVELKQLINFFEILRKHVLDKSLSSKIKIDTLHQMKEILNSFDNITHPESEDIYIIIHKIFKAKKGIEDCKECIISLDKDIANYNNSKDDLNKYYNNNITSEKLDIFKNYIAQIRHLGFDDSHNYEDIEKTKNTISICVENLKHYQKAINIIIDSHKDFFISNSLESNFSILKIIEIIETTPSDILAYRDPIIEKSTFRLSLATAENDYNKLLEKKEELTESFDIVQVDNATDLKDILYEFNNTTFFSFLSPKLHKAKRRYASLKNNTKVDPPQVCVDNLRQLIKYKNDIEAFCSNVEYKKNLGKFFDGLHTKFEIIKKLISWYELIRKVFSALDLNDCRVAEFLITLSEIECEALRKLCGENFKKIDKANYRDVINMFGDIENPLVRLEHFICKVDNANLMLKNEVVNKLTPLNEIINIIQRTEEYFVLKQELDKKIKRLIGHPDNNFPVSTLCNIQKAIVCMKSIAGSVIACDLFDYIIQTAEIVSYIKLKNDMLATSKTYLDIICSFTKLENDFGFAFPMYREMAFNELNNLINKMIDDIDKFDVWIDYLKSVEKCNRNKLQVFPRLVETGEIDINEITTVYHAAIYTFFSREICLENDIIGNFSSSKFDDYREKFRQLDEKMLKYKRLLIAESIDEKTFVVEGNKSGSVKTWTEYSLIKRELEKKTRHIPVRQLIARAKKTIQSLMPCYMMSPLSVAQYLGRDNFKFDIVVMDEASQLRPEYAIGSIARAKQMVVVGDPKQLPPTSFFDKLMDDNEEDVTALEDSESILESATSYCDVYRMLKWHYRSRHESLITFSNHFFYKNELIVFPSPHIETEKLGVKFNYIDGAIYSAGKNEKEARKVVEAIINHKQKFPNDSLGVVTLNSRQKLVIEDEIDNVCKRDPFIRALFNKQNKAEPFFIKNLENVQGDERDVILISITYGPDNEKKVFQNFGPINGKNGWRRLNVLFTRAKKRIELFSSIRSHDINIKESSSSGVVALRNYLKFAEDKIIASEFISSREPDSPFEVSVANALENRGFNITSQVGVAGFYVDLAVAHPEIKNKFILGIECDGASYHSSKSARDRDRLRQAILENLGWEIHRIWSTDWFHSPDTEIEKVVKKIDNLIAKESLFLPYARLESSEETIIKSYLDNDNVIVDAEEETRETSPVFSNRDARLELEKLKMSNFYIEPELGFTDLLSEDTIDELLTYMPENKSELLWLPVDVRLGMDPKQIDKLLPNIFDILRKAKEYSEDHLISCKGISGQLN